MTDTKWGSFDALDKNLINGELTAGRAGTFNTVNPATEETLGQAANADTSDLDAAIGAARTAFDTNVNKWTTDPAFRANCLRQLHKAFTDHADQIREMTIAEVGAPRFLTGLAQLDAPVEDIAYFADMAENYHGWKTDLGVKQVLGIDSHRWVLREPAGVVAAITPWNFPHQINLAKVAPALAAGCTVVLKPAPDTPWAAAVIGELVAKYTDIPAGVINVVNSDDHALGAQLSSDPRVDLISFTGSTETGKKVMRSAADNLSRVFLELGGKSAYIILDDADIGAATSTAAFAACTHAGQGCAITTRLLVPNSRYDEAVEATANMMGALAAGDPQHDGTVCGPLISATQRERVEGYLASAKAEGGTFVTGGGRPADQDKGYFVEPTLITGLDNSAKVAREEIFGPVLTVIGFEDDDEAVAIANDSPYGLSGAVHSGDLDRAWDVARRVRTGTMSVNGGLWYSGDVPFGGYKASGIGREMGVAGFEEYTEMKSVAEPAKD